jgi:hypothetical protein
MRLSQRLARKRIRRITVPGEQQALRRLARLGKKLEQARASREASPDDTKVAASCDAAAELIADGWIERRGGGERTKPVPLPEELQPYRDWWAKPPPEHD